MTLQSVTTAAPGAASETSSRSSGASARQTTDGRAFSQTLSQLGQSSTAVTVQAGDTLGSLVQKRLQVTHPGLQLSAEQLYRLALKVAADNGIANAHRIYPQQRIDLSSLASMAQAQAQALPVVLSGTPRSDAAPAAPAQFSRVSMAGAGAVGTQAFLAQHVQAARRAQASSGIPATFMVAQAALETGWGQREIRFDDGRSSHNLFGIRADANWKGPVAEVWTTEVLGGTAQKVRGQFRAYGSYEESFKDYARLISQNPRYAKAMRHLSDPQAFAASLQQAGYATAPRYANVLASVIQTAQRLLGSHPSTSAATTPSTAQVLGMRGPADRSYPQFGAPPSLSDSTAALPVGPRQWRQSPYAELQAAALPPP